MNEPNTLSYRSDNNSGLGYRVGFAQYDISPREGLELAGFAPASIRKCETILNPALYAVDARCSTREKQKIDAGSVFVTEKEVREYVSKMKTLFFEGRPVTNLRMCKLCLKVESGDNHR